MQVPSLPLSGLPTPPGLQTRGQETGGRDNATSQRRTFAARDDSTRITLNSAPNSTADTQNASATTAQAPGAVYAEIWKDGVRIAAVHTNGVVTPSFGLTWQPVAGDAAGVAQRRAEELARSLGGEVRYAGRGRSSETVQPPVDLRTERMRAKLRVAYGI